ncbi:hypothetical protein AsFcp4_259 [Aeromonas phage AsFcp_4]|uniref:Uncharacterized protein n=1 Tax=Aeromonas phage PX29 TaxID=926067 RepID=E5DQ36_9CAUD|nr:hypothetical protein CL89_gp103 [Aeromonas phage PX29]ADQ52822.1 conserved hypothetical protein [Aeromonas phage PX29]QAX98368.1 hypothetical protein ASfcp2_22 [Aeromonas phage AsFcp_2]QAX99711.1 hypothetical protein AsFcp4_259 [Aeromonas phage AsFcp_4]
MKKKLSVRAAVLMYAIPAIKSVPFVKFSNNDIVDYLRENSDFNKHLDMYNRKDDKINEFVKTRWVETWERDVRNAFKQSEENIEHMRKTHGIVFDQYMHNGKKVRFWHFDPKALKK